MTKAGGADAPTSQSGWHPPGLAGGWILLCAFCNCLGWGLSALHQLNTVGYVVAFTIATAIVISFRSAFFSPGGWRWRPSRQRRRWGRLLPFLFLTLAGMAIAGGVLHAPSNYDALAHRTPRVLHWLAEGRWHWVHTDYHRLNVRGCGIEWLTAPLIALTGSDRLLFAVNAICYLLLPGRVFGLLRGLGVSGRLAWRFMWLLPTGYCYLVQAGSIGNDLLGSWFAMAAIEYALRAGRSGRLSELWLAMLAAGMMTACKAFNLLLLLPWGLAALPALLLLFRRPVASLGVSLLAAVSSLVPTAWMNWRYCGDWTGQAAEQVANMGHGAPVLHLAVNAVLLTLQNLAPPVFPWTNAWRQFVSSVVPAAWTARIEQFFEPGGAHFELMQIQVEEAAGLGLGVTGLVLVILMVRIRSRSRDVRRERWSDHLGMAHLIAAGACVSLGVLLVQSGLNCPSRYLAPFYPLLIAPLLLGPSTSRWVAIVPWRCAAVLIFLMSGLVLVLSPARPLWPALTILGRAGAATSDRPLLKRAWTVYSVYRKRADVFAPARALLPPDANPIGLSNTDVPETSLWRPFGSRRVLHVLLDQPPEDARSRGIRYAFIGVPAPEWRQLNLDEWLARNNAELLQTVQIEMRAGSGPTPWYLVRWR